MWLKIACVMIMSVAWLQGATLVVTSPIQDGMLQNRSYFIGSLYFEERSNLASEVSGVIEAVYVKEGEKVKKGQKLALLNSDLLNQDIASREALLKQSKALLQKSIKDFERFESLYQSKSISFKEYEDALFALQAQEGGSQAIASELAKLKKEKAKKSLLAPYDGVILSQSLKRGEWVSVGASLFSIAKLTPLQASIDVPFDVMRALKVGQKVEMVVASKTYEASISALIPVGDAKSRTFPVKLSVNDPKGELIEGLEARVKFFRGGNSGGGLLVPRDAIVPIGKTNVIFVARNAKAVKVEVNVEGYSDGLALIRSKNIKLDVRDKVIVRGHERLKDGDVIKENDKADALSK